MFPNFKQIRSKYEIKINLICWKLYYLICWITFPNGLICKMNKTIKWSSHARVLKTTQFFFIAKTVIQNIDNLSTFNKCNKSAFDFRSAIFAFFPLETISLTFVAIASLNFSCSNFILLNFVYVPCLSSFNFRFLSFLNC